MRTIVDILEAQLQRLSELCRREGVSRAEAIRRAVARYLKGRGPPPDDAAFGLWRDRAIDGLEYQERLRREWP